jgi:FMN phosphatase YigB (HAD superfamily)
MNHFFKLCTLFLLVLSSVSYAEVIETSSFQEVLDRADEETLVVLDLGNTLMTTAQGLGSSHWALSEVKKLMNEHKISKKEALSRFIRTWHKVLIASRTQPVELTTAGVIKQLQNKGVKLVGLSAREIEMAYPTLDQLHSIGITLSNQTIHPYDHEIVGGHASKFIEGIIFAGLHNNKGETLFRFLEQVGYQPKKIIMIDDKPKNLKLVQAVAKQNDVPFVGLRYNVMDSTVAQYDRQLVENEWALFHWE